MKRNLISFILLISLCLTGCATNTQTENTLAGAATGAIVGVTAGNAVGKGGKHGLAIGLGAVTGAVIGAIIGHCLDSKDHNNSYPILTNNPMTTSNKWENPKTHEVFAMVPASNLYSIGENPNCRNFHFTSTRYTKVNDFDGRACLRSNGRWERVS